MRRANAETSSASPPARTTMMHDMSRKHQQVVSSDSRDAVVVALSKLSLTSWRALVKYADRPADGAHAKEAPSWSA